MCMYVCACMQSGNDSGSLWAKSIVEIVEHLSEVPEQWRVALGNNGGGFVNHVFYWEGLCSKPAGAQPTGELATHIQNTFGSFENFKSEFTSAALKLFGSGYVWLCQSKAGQLSIISTSNQVKPPPPPLPSLSELPSSMCDCRIAH